MLFIPYTINSICPVPYAVPFYLVSLIFTCVDTPLVDTLIDIAQHHLELRTNPKQNYSKNPKPFRNFWVSFNPFWVGGQIMPTTLLLYHPDLKTYPHLSMINLWNSHCCLSSSLRSKFSLKHPLTSKGLTENFYQNFKLDNRYVLRIGSSS